MNEKKQNLITIPEILRLVIPEDANEYESCWRKTKNCTSPTLFLEVNDCYAEMYYKLSQKKEEQIRKLIADTDILPSDSFQKLITIFFQED